MLPLRLTKLFAVLGISLCSPLLTAQQFVPNTPEFIVETLPASIVALSKELAPTRSNANRSRSATTLSDTQLENLEQQALAAYRIAVNTQEQRAYGHTLAVLERWPAQQEKTTNIHILLAAVLQHEHHFIEALSHLDAALTKAPNNAQAWLMRAQINLVIAEYVTARQDCKALSALVQPAIGINCLAQVDALTGNAQRSLDIVVGLLTESRDLSRQDYAELFTSAATFAQRLGKIEDAIRYYYTALQITPDQPYVLVHYAQLLLEQARHHEVIALFATRDERALPDEQRILFARALSMSSERQLLEQARVLKDSLEKSFEAAFKRHEALPNKAYAQFTLYLSHEPQKALQAAQANWSLQKEPSDTLLLALAAQESGARVQISDLAHWIEAHRTEDTRLDRVFSHNEEIR